MPDPAYRRRILVERLAHVRSGVRDLAARRERLTAGADALIESLEQLLPKVFDDFDRRWSDLGDIADADKQLNLRSSLCDDVQDLVFRLSDVFVPVIIGASARGVPVELELLVDRLVNTSTPDWPLRSVLWASPRHGYGIRHVSDPTSIWSEIRDGDATTSDEAPDFVFLGVPTLERDSALLHGVLVGHELGHLRDWYHAVAESLTVPDHPNFVDADGQMRLEAAVEADLYARLAGSWASELVADIFSALTLGPVSLIALPELATGSGGGLSVDLRTHPATDRRVQVLCEVLEDQGLRTVQRLAELLDGHLEDTAGAVDRRVALREEGPNEGAQLAWDWLRSELGAIKRKCYGVVPEAARFGAADWRVAEECARRLTRGAPCGERVLGDGTVEPVPLNVILNAGWLVKLDHMEPLAKVVAQDLDTLDGLIRVSRTLDDLVLKSVEISSYRSDKPWQ